MSTKHALQRLQAKARTSLLKRAASPEQSLLLHSIGDVFLYAQYTSTLITILQKKCLTLRVFYKTGDFRNASHIAPGAPMSSTQLKCTHSLTYNESWINKAKLVCPVIRLVTYQGR